MLHVKQNADLNDFMIGRHYLSIKKGCPFSYKKLMVQPFFI